MYVSVWLEECSFFYEHLHNRGCLEKAIDACFCKINLNQPQRMVETNKRKAVQDTLSPITADVFFSSETHHT